MAQIITNNTWGWGKGEKYIAWQDIAISWWLQTDTGSWSVSVSWAISLDWVIAYGWAVQNGTPTPTNPVDIECNNWVLKVNNWVVYADWTQETISDGTNTANAEMLLAISSDRDEQNLINWKITRKVKALALDWTEWWTLTSSPLGNIFKADILDDNMFSWLICTHFKNGSPLEDNIVYKSAWLPTLQIRYDTATSVEEFIQFLENENTNWTPVIVLYSLNTPTKESVAWQTLALTDWGGTFTITDAQITPLNIWVSYRIPWNIIDFTNETWYITEADLPTKVSELENDAWYITQADVPTKVSDLDNDVWYITKDVNDLTNYTKTSDLPDFSTYQLKSNMVTSLNSADNDHYPTAKAVKDAITSAWGWDVSWPSSSVDGHLAVFDWTTGKIIKDWWAIPTPTTVVDDLNTQSATSALSANQGYVLKWYIDAINWKIPSEASSSNKLADKNYVDDSINQVAAYYITKNAAWDAFATKAELLATTTFYSWWAVRTPTRNDYCIVLADETHNWETTRYSYQWSSWEYQYTVNETALTQQQVDALNSWITSTKVWQYDTAVSTIAWYWDIVTHDASEFATAAQWDKADTALQPNDNISELNNDAWYITWVNWGDIDWTLSDQVDLQNALNAKANDNGVVHTTWAETINGTKTFWTSPVVPNKTAAAANTWTAIATEAQVYKKQDALTLPATPTQWNLVTWGANNKTLVDWWAVPTGVPSWWNNWDVLTNVSWTPTWQAPSGWHSTITVTLTSAWWSSNSQTVSATGVTASNTVIVSPAPDDIADYADCGVYGYWQWSWTLTFKCDTAPSGDIVVNVLIMS